MYKYIKVYVYKDNLSSNYDIRRIEIEFGKGFTVCFYGKNRVLKVKIACL